MNKVSAIIKTQRNQLEEVAKGGKIQSPTATNKLPESSKTETEEEEKEPALRQALHIPSFTHEEATGPPGKDPVPQNRNKGAAMKALLWCLYFRDTGRDPEEIGRAQSRVQGEKKRVQQRNKKKCLRSIQIRILQLGETWKKIKIQGETNCQGE